MPIRNAIVSALALALIGGCAHDKVPYVAAAPVVVYVEPPVEPAAVVEDPADREFLDRMVRHDQQGIELARIGATRSEHPELGTMAGHLVFAQQAEIDRMTSWRRAWFEADDRETTELSAPAEAEAPEVSATVDGLNGLGALNEADPFDLAWIDAMIAHHKAGMTMAKALEADHPELQEFATRMGTERRWDVAQLREWRSAWYEGPDAGAMLQ